MVFVLTAMAGCAATCTLDEAVRATAGDGARDCGVVRGEDRAAVDACAVAAFEAREPYFWVYEHVVGDAFDGEWLWTLRVQTDPLFRRAWVSKQTCIRPGIVLADDTGAPDGGWIGCQDIGTEFDACDD